MWVLSFNSFAQLQNRSLCAYHLHIYFCMCECVLFSLRPMNVRLVWSLPISLSIFYCLIEAWLISFLLLLLLMHVCYHCEVTTQTYKYYLYTGNMRAYSIAMALIYMPHKILFVFVTFQIDYLKQKRAQPKWSAKRDRRMKGLKEKGTKRVK